MTESHITKLSPATSCIQFRLISEVVIGVIVGNSKELSIFVLLKIALQDFRDGFCIIKLVDQFVGEGHGVQRRIIRSW